MSAPHPTPLPDGLHRLLRAGLPVVLVTVDADGWGHTAMTWAVAVAPDRVRFGVDHGSATLANLERAGKAALQVIARDNAIALIKGRAKPVRARIAAPFAIAMWELVPIAVKDQANQCELFKLRLTVAKEAHIIEQSGCVISLRASSSGRCAGSAPRALRRVLSRCHCPPRCDTRNDDNRNEDTRNQD